jgi:hypothetical protein
VVVQEPGFISAVWEFGVRLFVDRTRLDEARRIVDELRANADADSEGRALPGT